MKINETNYIEKLKKGDEKALDYIVDQHLPLVKGTVRKILMQFNDSGLIEKSLF
ncbi:hypothetical protein [Clostridium muellerianum]|uniref:hypothetical protein n=1 Tax=Clostridium muellerianum TaxID=2716538 RepID=UPI001FAE0AA7|nr:hypothetical protein [Clostridium muellerianum]